MTADELVDKIKEDYPGMREYRLHKIAEEVLKENEQEDN